MVGDTIGSYRVLDQLGQGGMGTVYLAEHRHLHRKAAIKVLLKEFVARPDLLERFFAEARATSLIDHAGIVQIFDCEVDAEGRPYIVMEYLGGETLAGTLRRQGALPPDEAAAYARCMAEALAAAHDKGIIHRDIKPDNVFVRPGPPPSAKLVDFGIAKLADEFHAGLPHRTQTGIVMGTPLYMSPEQCRGAGKVDYRTDIYSLGCLMFEMLVGRPPFNHEGAGELVAAHLTEAPPELANVVPGVPSTLSALIGAMLNKQPAERPQTMQEVADRLDGRPSTARPSASSPPRAPAQDQGAPPAPAPAAGKAMTTLRATASEMRVDDDDDLAVPRRRAGAAVALAAVAALAVGGAWWWKKVKPDRAAIQPTAETAPLEPAPPAPAPGPAPTEAAAPSSVPRPRPAAAGASDPPRSRRSRPRTVAATSPPAPAAPVRIEVHSDPPGAGVCLDSDRRLIGRTPQVISLPRDGARFTLLFQLSGYRVKELSLRADRDARRAISLERIGADELAPVSVCR